MHQGDGQMEANWISASTCPLDRMTLYSDNLPNYTRWHGQRCKNRNHVLVVALTTKGERAELPRDNGKGKTPRDGI